MTTALVLSGETQVEDLTRSEYQPDILAADIAKMTELLKKALKG